MARLALWIFPSPPGIRFVLPCQRFIHCGVALVLRLPWWEGEAEGDLRNAGYACTSARGVLQPIRAMVNAAICMSTMKATHAGHLPSDQKKPGAIPAAVPPR